MPEFFLDLILQVQRQKRGEQRTFSKLLTKNMLGKEEMSHKNLQQEGQSFHKKYDKAEMEDNPKVITNRKFINKPRKLKKKPMQRNRQKEIEPEKHLALQTEHEQVNSEVEEPLEHLSRELKHDNQLLDKAELEKQLWKKTSFKGQLLQEPQLEKQLLAKKQLLKAPQLEKQLLAKKEKLKMSEFESQLLTEPEFEKQLWKKPEFEELKSNKKSELESQLLTEQQQQLSWETVLETRLFLEQLYPEAEGMVEGAWCGGLLPALLRIPRIGPKR
jgi:hypothetical protein